jgi:hypothetical protein
MSDAFNMEIATVGRVAAAEAAAAAGAGARVTRARTSQSTVFVDVGAKRIDPNVIRDGVPVGRHEINRDVLDDIIVERPILRVRVVGQSIAAGTPVPIGTAVSLTLAPAGRLPVGVIEGVHLGLRDVLIDDGFERFVAGRPAVKRIVSRSVSGTISPEDEAEVRQIFADEGVDIADTPGRDVGAAVEALRVLTTFGG